ncbi:MAG: hypothetical protein WAV70_22490, partial [Anaerolineae bacterium]
TQKRLTNASGTPLANYTYDDTSNDNKGKGRRTGMSDSSGITSWVYDTRGRLVQESKYVNGTGGGTFVTQWGYDSADRMTQMFYPGGEGVNFLYNEQGLLRRMYTTGLDYVQSTAYDGAGRVTQRVLGSSTVLLAEYTYFPWTMAGGRLQRMTLGTTGATTSLQDLTYSYDAVGNVKQQLSSALGSGASQKQCFSYDGLNRLTAGFTGDTNCAAYLGVGNGPFEEQYTYFANGNLDHKKIVQPTNQDNAYLYAAPVSGCTAGTLATKPHAVRQAGSNAYSYDCNGNMTGRTVGGVAYTLVYDAENRLQQVKQGSTAPLATPMTRTATGSRRPSAVPVYFRGIRVIRGKKRRWDRRAACCLTGAPDRKGSNAKTPRQSLHPLRLGVKFEAYCDRHASPGFAHAAPSALSCSICSSA